ncbi:MAG: DUF2017 family protein [Actinomycetota bacterium]
MTFERVDGGLCLAIDDHSRKVVVHLLGELRSEVQEAKVASPGNLAAHMKRLFPSAYHDDERLNDEYRRLTHGDIADSHIAAIDDAIALLTPDRVFTTSELERLVRAINAMRLVLGTLLDVSEGDSDDLETDEDADDQSDDPVAAQREVYAYLGWLLHTSLDQLQA